MQHVFQQSRIPEQQGIGQTLPPIPVGIDASSAPPLPPGAMLPGTRVQVGKYQVIVHNFFSEGGFAHVYTARIEGKSGYVVLKRVVVPDGERLKMVEKEIAFMKRLGDHKNIVRYYESRIDPLPVGGYEAFIIMEYCPGGGVIDLMNRRLQQRLTEPEILKIFSDVAEALAYMHYCNPPVLHRDLKIENILILNQDHYKLCDFGSAALSKGTHVPTSLAEAQKIEDDIQRHTTLQYRAPEMIDVYQKKPINEKADIWAMGVLLYKLCYYTTPFEEEGQLAILNARYVIPQAPYFSEGVRQLIISMLQEDQNLRPNIYQVLNAVCHLRGIECPIRDIYTDNSTAASYSQLQPQQQRPPSSSSADIFEKIPPSAQELPKITPMRRGRPTKPERTTEPPTATKEVPSPQPVVQKKSADPFAPTDKTSAPSSSPPSTSFQNNFVSELVSSPPPRVKSAPILVTPKPQMATKILQTQPNSPVHKDKAPEVLKKKPSTSSLHPSSEVPKKPSKSSLVVNEEEKSFTAKQLAERFEKLDKKEDTAGLPKLNRGVSSSIEARFMAIQQKTAATNDNGPVVRPSPTNSTTKKNKPAPPPKPSRFRTTPNDAVDEFENKFPSLEDLDKSLSS